MCPIWVLNCSILDWLPLNAIEDEDDPHHPRSNRRPANNPVHVWQKPSHLLHTLGKLIDSKNPSNGNGLNITFIMFM